MKLVIAVVNRDDANTVTQDLSRKGFYSTKLASSGGFLLAGNITLLVGVEEDKVQDVVDIIREHSHSRKQVIPATTEVGMNYMNTMPVEVNVGGAIIFVVDVERFERV